MSAREHLVAILLLPLTVIVIVPSILLILSAWIGIPWLFFYPFNLLTIIIGFILILLGLYALSKTILYFARIGKGTLAPWTPTQQLVVIGVYRHVRNPMILGVILTLFGEVIVFGSLLIFIWFGLFWGVNHLWFVFWEEPDLERRFGIQYLQYKANVPRWIPRRHPWTGNSNQTDKRI